MRVYGWLSAHSHLCSKPVSSFLNYLDSRINTLFAIVKKSEKSALKSLRWLRGWVPHSIVQAEFDNIKRHHDLCNSCESCKASKFTCVHEVSTQTTWQAIKELFRKSSLKPYIILTVLCGVTAYTGSRQLIVYMVQILKVYRSPVNPNFGMVVQESQILRHI